MIPRGVLVPVEGGFEVYLRDESERDSDISREEPAGVLTARQRFSLAHEIAHTRFYSFASTVPSPEKKILNDLDLEEVCNRVAGHILIPTALLKREVRGYGKEIDAEFVQSVASKFRTSFTVVLERLSFVEPSNPIERCIFLARRCGNDAEIRAWYFGAGMLPIIPRPQKYTRVTKWIPNFPKRALDHEQYSASITTRMGRVVTFTRIGTGLGNDVLVEAQAA